MSNKKSNNKKESANSANNGANSSNNANNVPAKDTESAKNNGGGVTGANLDNVTTDGKESNNTKGAKTGGKKVDANCMETSKDVIKVGLTVSEKALIKSFDENAGRLLLRVLNGKSDASAVKQLFARAIAIQVLDLKTAGAHESAAVLNETFRSLIQSCTVPTLETVRKIRTKVQEERKAEKREQELQEKEDKIRELANKFGLSFDIAKQMFAAGALKI